MDLGNLEGFFYERKAAKSLYLLPFQDIFKTRETKFPPSIKKLLMGIIFKDDDNNTKSLEFFKDEWKRSGHPSLGSYITYIIYDEFGIIRSPSEVEIYKSYNKFSKLAYAWSILHYGPYYNNKI